MAKKKNTTSSPLRQTNVWDIAAQQYKSDVLSKTATTLGWGNVFNNAVELMGKRDEERKLKLKNYIAQQPEFDTGNVLAGTEDEFGKLLKLDNLTYREIAEKLSRIGVDHPHHESLTKQLNQINKNIQQAKMDSDKIMEIRNAKVNPDELATMEGQEKRMWMDIMGGDGSNFKAINGKMYWIDPESQEQVEFSEGSEQSKVVTMIQACTNTDDLNEHFNNEGVALYNPDGNWSAKKKQQFLLDKGYGGLLDPEGEHDDEGVDGDWQTDSKNAEATYLKDRSSTVSDSENLYKATGVFDPEKITIDTHPDNFIPVSEISNDGPRTINFEAQGVLTDFLVEALQFKSQGLEWNSNTRDIYDSKVQSMFRTVLGNDGMISLIFDDILPGFDGQAFQQAWIMGQNEGKNPGDVNMQAEINKMIKGGVTREMADALKEYYINSYLKPKFGAAEGTFDYNNPGGNDGDDSGDPPPVTETEITPIEYFNTNVFDKQYKVGWGGGAQKVNGVQLIDSLYSILRDNPFGGAGSVKDWKELFSKQDAAGHFTNIGSMSELERKFNELDDKDLIALYKLINKKWNKEIGGADLVVPPEEVLKHPSKSGKELENEQIVKVVDKYYNNLFNSITKTFGLIDQDARGAIYYHESDPNKFYTEEEMIAAAQSGEISAEGGWNVKE